MRHLLALVSCLAPGSIAAAASAAEPPPPHAPAKKPFPRWRTNHFIEGALALNAPGVMFVHGPEVSYALTPHLRLGGALQLPLKVSQGYHCADPWLGESPCNFYSVGLRSYAELHAAQGTEADPWIRGGIMPLVHAPRAHTASTSYQPDLGFFASAGIDFNIGPVFVSLYGTVSAFVGEQAHLGGGGLRLGGQF
ncbi:hypothetical protein [Polyangium jinanense]|uniref:Uncharacterized protein n=1 Tax=Polyangium jinanense TaxID=2829994 RepID=A0A9X3XC82_9BACT|nr:hypothetical protein [Polyangium jinanense]MDC3961875.1 hypothetical protein [Polyangium jinanense]MDC3987807.1 hypothetical protein [Polyangium jinanense]